MKRRKVDLFAAWHSGPHAIAVPVSGALRGKSGHADMSTGEAQKAAKLWWEVGRALGAMIEVGGGEHCYVLPALRQTNCYTVSFPVRVDQKSSLALQIIERSAKELIQLADIYGWEKVFLPQLNGKSLKWERDIKPVLSSILDDRFVVCKEHVDKSKPIKRSGTVKVQRGAVKTTSKARKK